MNRRAGRPPASLDLTPHSEIAARLGTSESTVKRLLKSAIAKLEAADQLENLIGAVKQAKAAREVGRIPCGSIECRPEKWLFYR